MQLEQSGNGVWVAAEEECITESGQDVVNKVQSSDMKIDAIRVYKVNKGVKKWKGRSTCSNTRMKSLKEMKHTVKKEQQGQSSHKKHGDSMRGCNKKM